TRAAWVVNQLARADPGAPRKLAELAAALRAAQQARNGARLRELSGARGALVDALTAQALAVAGVTDPSPSLQLEVAQTLTAVIADPEVAADFAKGTLTHAVQWSGFGLPPADTETDESETDAAVTDTAVTDAAPGSGVTARAGRTGTRRPAGQARPGPRTGATPAPTASPSAPASPVPPAPDAARRQAELNERLEREAAERAARRREQYEEAERLVADSAAGAAEAVSAEDRLEAEVRDLEQRLTQARAELAGARMRARHAEAAERRARQALDRLPGE
ncbi:MAG: hypothetical protein ACRDNO_34480, partial [Trebonia sp.]